MTCSASFGLAKQGSMEYKYILISFLIIYLLFSEYYGHGEWVFPPLVSNVLQRKQRTGFHVTDGPSVLTDQEVCRALQSVPQTHVVGLGYCL